MNTLKRTILKLVTILIFALLSSVANAGYVDIAYSEKMVIKTTFYADGFIVNADNDNNFGMGYGFQDGPIETYFGIGAPEYIFSEIMYKNGRDSIYNFGVKYQHDEFIIDGSYTKLTSEDWGFLIGFEGKRLKLGVKKYI